MVVYNLAAVLGFSPLLWTPHSESPNNVPRAYCRTTSTLPGAFDASNKHVYTVLSRSRQ